MGGFCELGNEHLWFHRRMESSYSFQRIYLLRTDSAPWRQSFNTRNIAMIIRCSDIHLPRCSLGVAATVFHSRNIHYFLFPATSEEVSKGESLRARQCLDVSPIYRICPGTQNTPNVPGILTIFPSAATAGCRVSRQPATSGED